MYAAYIIVWFCLLVFLGLFMDGWFNHMAMCRMFPEGKRIWHRPVCWLFYSGFALLVLANPWSGPIFPKGLS